MMRLLRVTEGQPAIIFRFTETPGETPREVLERAQAAVRKALKGDPEPASSSAGGGGGQVAGAKAAGKGKGGKDGGWVFEYESGKLCAGGDCMPAVCVAPHGAKNGVLLPNRGRAEIPHVSGCNFFQVICGDAG